MCIWSSEVPDIKTENIFFADMVTYIKSVDILSGWIKFDSAIFNENLLILCSANKTNNYISVIHPHFRRSIIRNKVQNRNL